MLEFPADVLMALDGEAAAGGGTNIGSMVFLGVIAAIFYFLIIRPQSQERKKHVEFLSSLAKDDDVVTSSGMHGRVVSVEEHTVVLQVSDKARLTMDKSSLARRKSDPPPEKK